MCQFECYCFFSINQNIPIGFKKRVSKKFKQTVLTLIGRAPGCCMREGGGRAESAFEKVQADVWKKCGLIQPRPIRVKKIQKTDMHCEVIAMNILRNSGEHPGSQSRRVNYYHPMVTPQRHTIVSIWDNIFQKNIRPLPPVESLSHSSVTELSKEQKGTQSREVRAMPVTFSFSNFPWVLVNCIYQWFR